MTITYKQHKTYSKIKFVIGVIFYIPFFWLLVLQVLGMGAEKLQTLIDEKMVTPLSEKLTQVVSPRNDSQN